MNVGRDPHNLLRRLPIIAAIRRVFLAAALDIIATTDNHPFHALELVGQRYFQKSAVVFTVQYI